MKGLTLLALLACSAPACADLITLDPEGLAAGTDLTDYYDGVTMRAVHYQSGGTYTFGRVHAAAHQLAPTGSMVFESSVRFPNSTTSRTWDGTLSGSASCVFTLALCGFDFGAMLIEFDQLTDHVSLAASWGSDAAGLWLFNSEGVEVGRCASIWGWSGTSCYNFISNESYGSSWELSFTSAAADIRYAVAAGMSASARLDSLAYNSVNVPEPGTLALFWLGALGCAFIRRRRNHAV